MRGSPPPVHPPTLNPEPAKTGDQPVNCKALMTLTFFSLVALASPGCVAPGWDASVGFAYGPPVEYGYQPLLYNGYVVYYTNIGEPYYWRGGVRITVPAYARGPYVGHWRRYKEVYPTWYKHRGAYYRTRQFHGRGNPPGPAGGPGTNWKNPPGPVGGPGASRGRPDARPHYRDRDDNPPGPAGGRGTNWENRPGPAGGPGASPDRRPGRYRDRDGNPPGPAGGRGTNWENRPGPAGGPGASPDRRRGRTGSADTDSVRQSHARVQAEGEILRQQAEAQARPQQRALAEARHSRPRPGKNLPPTHPPDGAHGRGRKDAS